ncbi:aminoglycoside phosphotransferase family protein [Fangia hongkongensis]|uniref:aminoglycoside phosphotransferase family protein n=1 Tax=Fangia hongkongensis TaxID=270495 RepID=UPI001907BCD7|nr:aminoglycoside phosphotransferase family protein [Fangia hongkongensis]
MLEKNVINVWGDTGREWLNRLPNIIDELSMHWKLSNVMPVENISYNYVAFAKQDHNTPVVLKCSCDQALIKNEYRALKHWDGVGSIRVIDSASCHNALLLEQAIPGMSLKENYSQNIENTIEIYAGIVKTLASKPIPIPKTQYTHVKKWCQAIDNITDPRISLKYIDKAKELKAYLLSSNRAEYLCHGDLHLDNIIRHQDSWLSIDPKGIIGEMAFEASAFDVLNQSDWNEINTIPDKINQRLSRLANNLDIPEDRLRSWVFLRAIISAQWFIEDNGNPDEMLRLASVLYPSLMR